MRNPCHPPVAVRGLRRAARRFGAPHVARADRPDLPFLMLSRPGSERSSAHGPGVRGLCGGKAPLYWDSDTGSSRGGTR